MRKFYSNVAVGEDGTGFTVTLDGRPIKTPMKNALVMPARNLAQSVADEWIAQEEIIVPASMPMTTLVNTSIDRVAMRRAETIAELVAYGHTDLVCYRAEEPDELVALQVKTWDPFLGWLQAGLGIELVVTTGVLPLTQSGTAMVRLASEVEALDDFALTAFHAFVSGFGSIVLALAAIHKFKSFEDCWQASILDQSFQEGLWGTDPEVLATRERQWRDLLTSVDLWHFAKT